MELHPADGPGDRAGAAGGAAGGAEDAEQPGGFDMVQAQALPVPNQPTVVERVQHSISHTPYRAWCAACVQGAARVGITTD